MIGEPEFVRGNQKSYIRIVCESDIFNNYEYQMCAYNVLNSFLDFQQRSQNGISYLYYEVSGMQSLDIFVQAQKLKRTHIVILAKSIVKLCKELSEYALNIHSVNFQPKYIMITGGGEAVRFLYNFQQEETVGEAIEQFFECCIEHLDYRDELLMEQLYQVYERLLEQKENFSLLTEMERIIKTLEEEESVKEFVITVETAPTEDSAGKSSRVSDEVISPESKVAQREHRNLRIGLVVLLLLDLVLLFVWQPLNILKIFFGISIGLILLGLNIHVYRQGKLNAKEVEENMDKQEYIEEYEELAKICDMNNGGTQIISIRETDKFLYNLQNEEPRYIYIEEIGKLIGKDSQKVQVCIPHEGVSRVHALVVRKGKDYIVEDLNSTNGTWVNGNILEPRAPHVLKEGDKVRFADLEYIFR